MADTSRQKEEQQYTDQDLVTQTLANKQAFAKIVRRYEAPLLRYITRLGCRNTATAQDLLQEIFIKTYVHLNDYDHSLQFSSWIYRIAHNEIISSFRKEKNGPIVLEREGDLFLFDKVVDDLENDIYPKKDEEILPKYVSLVVTREKPHLVYEKRIVDGKRLNIKMVLPEEYDLHDQLVILNEKIKEKYEGECIL